MPLTDDDFLKNGVTKDYTEIMDELQEEQDKNKVQMDYEFDVLEEED